MYEYVDEESGEIVKAKIAQPPIGAAGRG